MTIRAILFDLDGTLIDQFQAIHKSFSQVISEMGFPVPSFDTVKKSVGGASEKTMSKLIGEEHAKEAVQLLRPIFEKEMLSKNGIIIIHRHKKDAIKLSEKLNLLDSRLYGISKIVFAD